MMTGRIHDVQRLGVLSTTTLTVVIKLSTTQINKYDVLPNNLVYRSTNYVDLHVIRADQSLPTQLRPALSPAYVGS